MANVSYTKQRGRRGALAAPYLISCPAHHNQRHKYPKQRDKQQTRRGEMESLHRTITLREQDASTRRPTCTDNVGEEKKRGKKGAKDSFKPQQEREITNACGGGKGGAHNGAQSLLNYTRRQEEKRVEIEDSLTEQAQQDARRCVHVRCVCVRVPTPVYACDYLNSYARPRGLRRGVSCHWRTKYAQACTRRAREANQHPSTAVCFRRSRHCCCCCCSDLPC